MLYGGRRTQVPELEGVPFRMRRAGYDAGAGLTIRGSFEEVVAMPGKVRKSLKVLDGVLDLLKRAA